MIQVSNHNSKHSDQKSLSEDKYVIMYDFELDDTHWNKTKWNEETWSVDYLSSITWPGENRDVLSTKYTLWASRFTIPIGANAYQPYHTILVPNQYIVQVS